MTQFERSCNMMLPSRLGRSRIEFFTLRRCNAEISYCLASIRLRTQLSRSIKLSSERSSGETASRSGKSRGSISFPEHEDKVGATDVGAGATSPNAGTTASFCNCGASFAFLLNANLEVGNEAFRSTSRDFSSSLSCYISKDQNGWYFHDKTVLHFHNFFDHNLEEIQWHQRYF